MSTEDRLSSNIGKFFWDAQVSYAALQSEIDELKVKHEIVLSRNKELEEKIKWMEGRVQTVNPDETKT